MLLAGLVLSLRRHEWIPSYEQYGLSVVFNNQSYEWSFSAAEFVKKLYTWELKAINGTESGRLYWRIFDSLLPSDLPSGVTPAAGANVYRCWDYTSDARRCRELASIYDFDWYLDQEKPMEALYWRSDGHPALLEFGLTPTDWEVEIELRCGTTNSYSMDFDPEVGDRIRIMHINQAACGKTPAGHPPTPTPAFSPDPHVHFRQPEPDPDVNGALYIDVNLDDLDGGRFGVTGIVTGETIADTRWIAVNLADRTLMCPWSARCDVTMSSLWACSFHDNGALDHCYSYGLLSENVTYSLTNKSNIFGDFQWRLSADNGRSALIRGRCWEDWPFGQVAVDIADSSYDDTYMTLVLKSEAFCPRRHPDPIPVSGCAISGTWKNTDWTVNLTLSDYNPPDKRPLNWTVNGLGKKHTIHYMPCGGAPCPSGFDCGGDENAFVWLCEVLTDSVLQPYPRCTAYGLWKYDFMATLRGGVGDGVQVLMNGEGGRLSMVGWLCDPTLQRGTVGRLQNFALLEQGLVYFEITASEACGSGTGPSPSPVPRQAPPYPTVPASTPVPLRSPWPIHFRENGTHYVLLDLEGVEGQPMATTIDQTWQGITDQVMSVWTTWRQTPCPLFQDCGNFSMANLWICWRPPVGERKCYPAADKYQPGSHFALTVPDSLSGGITFTYAGAAGAESIMRFRCDWSERRLLPIDDVPVLYDDSVGHPRWEFNNVPAAVACPRGFERPLLPGNPVPPRNRSRPREFVHFWTVNQSVSQVGVKHYGVDLARLKPHNDTSVVISERWLGPEFREDQVFKASFYFSFVKPVGCPAEDSCGIYGGKNVTANVWECLERPNGTAAFVDCFPVGTSDSGLWMRPMREGSHIEGVSVAYGGGVSRFRNTTESFVELLFFCTENDSLAWDAVEWRDVSFENATHLQIVGALRSVCPHQRQAGRSGGAVFLLIVVSASVFYFVVLGLVAFCCGAPRPVPNESFWVAVREGFEHLLSCGGGKLSYDKI